MGIEGGPRQPRLLERNMTDLASVPAPPPTSWEGRCLTLWAWGYSRGFAVRGKCDVVYSRCSINAQHLKNNPFLSLWCWRILLVDEGTRASLRGGKRLAHGHPAKARWRGLEPGSRSASPSPLACLPHLRAEHVCPGAPGTHRPGELMCNACPVESRTGILGAQNGQCGALHPPLGRTGQALG